MNVSGRRIGELFERWYLPTVLALWCLAPGLRRLIDWQVGRTPLSIISILPLLSLLPLIIFVIRSKSAERVRLPFKVLAFFWLFGFGYSLIVAFAAGSKFGAVYDFAEFCLPMLIGAWVIMRPASRAETFATLTVTLLWLGSFASVYAIFQYVAPPPWDVEYVNNANQISLGVAEPFGLRPFSTLNSPGTLSLFLVAVILLNVQRLTLRRPWPLLGTLACMAALTLTNVRSSWLALAVGIVAYLVLSPKRGQAILALGAVFITSAVLLLNASTLLGNPALTQQLQQRINTLGSVDEDESVNARRAESSYALHQGLAEPLGQGLGSVGGGVKLEEGGSGTAVLDNGYLARFLEMGIAGFICYIATLACGIIFGFQALAAALKTRNITFQQLAIAGLSVQAALIGLDLSSDFHDALPGFFFWIVLGLALRHEPGDDGQRAAWDVRPSLAEQPKSPLWA